MESLSPSLLPVLFQNQSAHHSSIIQSVSLHCFSFCFHIHHLASAHLVELYLFFHFFTFFFLLVERPSNAVCRGICPNYVLHVILPFKTGSQIHKIKKQNVSQLMLCRSGFYTISHNQFKHLMNVFIVAFQLAVSLRAAPLPASSSILLYIFKETMRVFS